MTYITKDSGQREDFATGARRDTQEGKPRYDLIPVEALKRLALLYARGAEKYGESNWQKGIPYSRVLASLLRHVYAWVEGDDTEDHLAAVAWNAFALMAYESRVRRGELPSDLADAGPSLRQEEFKGILSSLPPASPKDEGSLLFRITEDDGEA